MSLKSCVLHGLLFQALGKPVYVELEHPVAFCMVVQGVSVRRIAVIALFRSAVINFRMKPDARVQRMLKGKYLALMLS
jgi:hypothetical protein